jgi:hypothetical protein
VVDTIIVTTTQKQRNCNLIQVRGLPLAWS